MWAPQKTELKEVARRKYIQCQLNNIARAYAMQQQIPESMSESENTSDEDISMEQHSSSSDEPDSDSDYVTGRMPIPQT